ncbi:MAG: sugar transferase [Candidatus Wenzhouxiangella sp. M2_3B_020]
MRQSKDDLIRLLPGRWAGFRTVSGLAFDSRRPMRILTVAVAAILAALLAPVMAIIAATILVMTGPPILYRQARLGRNGREFRILKFRTLRPDSDGPRIATPGDPRITSVGRVLRRFHLDELPQIFNILRGEMAFVGPRTEPPGIWVGVDADRRARLLRHRPGITSPASVEFLCEDEVLDAYRDAESLYREIVFPAKVERDLQYFERRSVVGDLAVVFHTLKALLSRDDSRCRRRVERLLRSEMSAKRCTQS